MDHHFNFHIICTTIGRPTLPRLLNSLRGQLLEEDTVTLISDIEHSYVERVIKEGGYDFKIIHIINHGPQSGFWGHSLLNAHMNNVSGDFIMFADDDDRYTDNAFKVIREHVTEKKLYIFKHLDWNKDILWRAKTFDLGNIGKCMGVIPNTKQLPDFKLTGDGDQLFYRELSKIMKSEFIDEIIYIVRD